MRAFVYNTSLYPSMIASLWDFSPKSEMGWSLEPKGLQQQRQIFVFTSLVGVLCAIFVWNSRSPALACSDLFTSNFTSGCLRISLRTQTYFRLSLDSAENNLFRRNQGQPEIRLHSKAIYAWAVWLIESIIIIVLEIDYSRAVSWCWPKDAWALGTRLWFKRHVRARLTLTQSFTLPSTRLK